MAKKAIRAMILPITTMTIIATTKNIITKILL
jgi:hypothetical protein